MAIIRNERAPRPAPEPPAETTPEEEEIDYSWHPSEDEFVSPLTAEQWAELLGDPDFSETDAAKAVRCLREYGEPATFQQLSIRYRGTMGRYRRWLGEAAQAAGMRYGVEAPQKDQFGMDEWWPLLYLTRATGKPGAGVFEMDLRPEVQEAFGLIDEQEKQAKRAENVRQLQRIEQLERARREERERHAAEQAAANEARRAAENARRAEERQRAVEQQVQAQAQAQAQAEAEAQAQSAAEAQMPVAQPAPAGMVRTVAEVAGVQGSFDAAQQNAVSAPMQQSVVAARAFPALSEFLQVVRPQDDQGGSRFVASARREELDAFDAAGPLDYALRYAERLRTVLALIRAGYAPASAAAVARELGDTNVQHLQDILNGQTIPEFSYLDALKERLFVNPEYLEAPEGLQDELPAFCSYDEVLHEQGASPDLMGAFTPVQIAYVVDDSKTRRTGVILRFSKVRCALLTRGVVHAESKAKKNPELEAFVRMVDELDTFAREQGIARTSHTVSAADWDKLVAGSMWPGALL